MGFQKFYNYYFKQWYIFRKYLHQKGMDSTQPGKKKTKKKPLVS